MLRLNLLGGFAAIRDETHPIPIASGKGIALLAYLALTSPRAQTRDRLTDLLWTDQPREQGRNNLCQTMSRLRRAFSDMPDVFVSRGDTLVLNAAHVTSDFAEFKELSGSSSRTALSLRSSATQATLPLHFGPGQASGLPRLFAGVPVRPPAFRASWSLVL